MKPSSQINGAFERLEPYDGKLSRTVLRGRRRRKLLLCYPTLILLFSLPALADDFTWVQEAMKTSKSHDAEAKNIIENMSDNAAKHKRCRATQMIVSSAQKRENQNPEKRYPDLLVFVSFSMPTETLKSLNAQVIEHGGKLVFRGLIDGSFKKMAEALKDLSAEVLIDPTLFEDHGITQVPVFLKGKDKLTGNVSLAFVLSKFEEEK